MSHTLTQAELSVPVSSAGAPVSNMTMITTHTFVETAVDGEKIGAAIKNVTTAIKGRWLQKLTEQSI